MNERFPQHFWGMFALSVAIVVLAFVGASAIRDAKRASDTITVTGSARKSIRSDYATWGGGVACLTLTYQESFKELKRQTDRIRAYLKEHHVPDSAITFFTIRPEEFMEPQDRKSRMRSAEPEPPKFLGYKLSQRFSVTSSLVDSIDALSRGITDLISEGFAVGSESPQYFYTKLNELRIEMLGEATRDAKLRAEQIAESAGGKIRSLRNARMGVFQITAPNSREVRDYGIYDTSTIEKDITAVVTVTFAVE
jgi:hypothetical protein